MAYNMYVPTRVLFGDGELNRLHRQKMPGKKAMLIISEGKSARENGYLSRTEEQLKQAGVEIALFDKVQANPLLSAVTAGGAFARENGCDFIVALGGGSCIDAAKAIAVVAANPGNYWDYIVSGTGKKQKITQPPLPLVAIPTTAGTGSETDAGAVITNGDTNEKTGLAHPQLFPVLAVIDPELTHTVPPIFTAYQGFDALFHSAEGYVSNGTNLMSDMYALTSIENVSRYLPRAVADGRDREARERVAFGSTLSGVVMCVGRVTSQHALEHAMSAYYQDLHHGAGLIMISKAYFTHLIGKQICDDRFIQMAAAMGMRDAGKPMDFVTMLEKLQEETGVANLKMSDYGITPADFEKFAHNARQTMGGLFLCDRAELSAADCAAIYEASYK